MFTKNILEIPQDVQLAYLSVAVLLVCWATLFVFLIKINNNNKLSGYGRTDLLTGLHNKYSLKEIYSGNIKEFVGFSGIIYISFNADAVVRNCNRESLNKLQKAIGKVLSNYCEENEYASRVEDGVFVAILNCQDGVRALHKASVLIEKINVCYYSIFMDKDISVNAGIYLFEDKDITFEQAYDNAKLSFEFAKRDSIPVLIFSDDLIEKDGANNHLYRKFEKAIENEEFEMFLQFIYGVEKGRFVSAEVLSRWNSPDEGFLMPAYYINDLYSSGMIERFDLYMLDKTCALLELWSGDEQFKDIVLSCNVTRVTISSDSFLEEFRKILTNHPFERSKLVLEITEDAFIGNQENARKNIIGCKNVGIKIALDDFGSGSASFIDINDYSIDQIKIDRNFISKVTTSKGVTLLQSFISMAHSLKISVVCEGVENEKQLAVVTENGCDYIQGYYYSYVYSVDEGKKHYLKSLGKLHLNNL